MTKSSLNFEPGRSAPLYRCRVLVVGSGAAGLNCAEQLRLAGVDDVAVISTRRLGGTSYRSGSDKQTYYKLSNFGDTLDGPMEMAHSLFDGGAMDGGLAYIESLYSLPAFYHLVEIGVPFPSNRYGAFVGYKTDHDPRQRATSAGPKTSRYMVEKELLRLKSLGVPVLDGLTAVRLVTAGRRVLGLVALDENRSEDDPALGLTVFQAGAVVLATGGPGELYAVSVYPAGQVSLHGAALEAGAAAVNLGESQFGLASTRFRWNLSGTYQQVIPAYFSLGPDGRRRDFLAGWYRSLPELAGAVFLKGYQWPFHVNRLDNFGSSLVDLAVGAETESGRRVFLDFTRNPARPGESFDLDSLPPEALNYLNRSGARQADPYRRLRHMNPESIAIYAEHGIDLREPLEAAVCFQHNNGGLKVNADWETDLAGLFAAGELAGTHGVTRPGGAALNSGQVGGFRIARCLAGRRDELAGRRPAAPFQAALREVYRTSRAMLASDREQGRWRRLIQERMSAAAGFRREPERVRAARREAEADRRRLESAPPGAAGRRNLARAWETRNLVLTQLAFLKSIDAYLQSGGGSRGSGLVLAEAAVPGARRVELVGGRSLCFRPERPGDRRLRVAVSGPAFTTSLEEVAPLPRDESWFETVWADWKAGRTCGGGKRRRR
ncbi:MAG TPA: FAD-binding protein [bacterium]|uniref:Succinate dehydrogenase flavoprotein subunit n=1 Tax=candidate division TA06 bacterium ADurb.Bin417 TaxID=1852828 RepID=A0A1V5MH63_UNCT6|nr:MAG: succinate dehydrogenase flavoprotein subunit [candidate division TA06 bacterium ADurb.Bin417]HNQ34521.1 FAD-binding protein [bacterium]HNS48033.1 FAD-binding protein [bacterium]